MYQAEVKRRPTRLYCPNRPHQYQIGLRGHCFVLPDYQEIDTGLVVALDHLTGTFWTRDYIYQPCY